jgi:hypothetical protein
MSNMELETITKLYFELSQITTATTSRKIELEQQLAELREAITPLHHRVIDLQNYYGADDCFVIDEATALDIMALGGDESKLAALLQEKNDE